MDSVFPLVLQWTNQQKTVPDWQAVCWPSWLGGGATQQAWWGFEVVYVEPGSGWPWAVDCREGGCGWLTWTWPGLWSCHGEMCQDFFLVHIYLIHVHFFLMRAAGWPQAINGAGNFFYSGAMLSGSCWPPGTLIFVPHEKVLIEFELNDGHQHSMWVGHHTCMLSAQPLPPLYIIYCSKSWEWIFFF